MKREFKITFIGLSVICIVIGIIMIAWPDGARRAACAAMGAVCGVLGIIRIISCLRLKSLYMPDGGGVTGVVMIAAGLLVLFRPDAIAAAVMALLGIGVIAGGFISLQIALALKNAMVPSWKRDAIIAGAAIAAGIFLLFDPFAGARAMTIAAGVLLVLNGLANGCMAVEMRKLGKIMGMKEPK